MSTPSYPADPAVLVAARDGTCGSCPASAEGCTARRLFGGEPCCRRCTHPVIEEADQ